jgi:hypothetical protein
LYKRRNFILLLFVYDVHGTNYVEKNALLGIAEATYFAVGAQVGNSKGAYVPKTTRKPAPFIAITLRRQTQKFRSAANFLVMLYVI